MIYKNVEYHNVAEVIAKDQGVTWKRFPSLVCNQLELDTAKVQCTGSTGVELRFIIKGDSAVIRMAAVPGTIPKVLNTFHVFHGAIQGSWDEHEVNRYVDEEVTDFLIKRPDNLDILRRITNEAGYDWDPEVVRVVFDRGHYRIVGIYGDIEAPSREQMPRKTLMAYGSSITHGSNAYNRSNTWVSSVAHQLNMDARNLGMAGSCAMEPAVVDYIAEEGVQGNWDLAILELGINVIAWSDEKIRERVSYTLNQIAGRNPDKPVVVISPFYWHGDYIGKNDASRWRSLIETIVKEKQMKNLTLLNGLDLLGDMSLISADLIHPSIYGVQQIADRLVPILRGLLSNE